LKLSGRAMRILHIAAPGPIGGLERVLQLLAQGQAQAGADVHVALVLEPGDEQHPLIASLTAAGVTPHSLVLAGRAYRRERAAVAALCRRLRPQVVHTHGYRADVVDGPAARRTGVPIVTTVHGFCGGDWKNRLFEGLQRRAFRRADAVVVVSRPLEEQLITSQVPEARIHVVQNAWAEQAPALDREAARRALGVRGNGFRLGWVGRLSEEKGADVLVEALPHLADLPLAVSIVGDGRMREGLRSRLEGLGLNAKVERHGAVPDVGRLFAAFDVFVLSSRTEGTPIVLFEAMAAGVPIVTTAVGGVPDVVSPAEAILVPREDPEALAAGIRAVYSDPAAALERAQRARARLAEFNVPQWVARYDAIYQKLLDREPMLVMV